MGVMIMKNILLTALVVMIGVPHHAHASLFNSAASSGSQSTTSNRTKFIAGAALFAGVTAGAVYLATWYKARAAKIAIEASNRAAHRAVQNRLAAFRSSRQIELALQPVGCANEYVSLDYKIPLIGNMAEDFPILKNKIEEKIALGLPYIIARVVVRGSQGYPCVYYFDAHNFNKYIFSHYPIVYKPEYLGSMLDLAPAERYITDHYVYDPDTKNGNREIRRVCINKLPLEHDHIHYFSIDPQVSNQATYLTSFKDLLQGPQAKKMQDYFFDNSGYAGKLHATLSHDDEVVGVKIVENNRVVTASRDAVRDWDFPSGIFKRKIDCGITGINCMAGGLHNVVVCGGKTVQIIDLQTGLAEKLEHKDLVYAAYISPDGKFVVTGSRDKAISICNMEAAIGTFFSTNGVVCAVAMSADHNYVVIGLDGKKLEIYNRETNESDKVSYAGTDAIHLLKMRPGTTQFVCGFGKTIAIFDYVAGAEISSFEFPAAVHCMDVSHDGACVAVGVGNTANVRKIDGWEDKYTVVHKDLIRVVKMGKKYLVTGSRDKTAKVWDLATGALKYVLPHDGEVLDVDMSSDEHYVVTASADKTTKIWKL